MNGVRRKLWPENVQDFQSFANVPHIQRQIVGLAKEVAFDEVDEEDAV